MSFWCSIYLYVPVERLSVALRAVAAFAEPDREGTIDIQLPNGEVVPMPRLGSDPASTHTLGCRGHLELVPHGTFWFPVDEVILEEEADWFEEEELELPIQERDGVECFPVANIRLAVAIGCRFAELSFDGQNNSVSRELFGSESIHEWFLDLQEEIGAVAGAIHDTDRRQSLFTLDEGEEDFDWRPFLEKNAASIDTLAEALCKTLGEPVPAVTVEPAWLAWNGGAVRRMAETLATEGDLTQLPILADALEEAGCQDAFLLGHCRAGLAHSGKGCRVLDLLLAVPEEKR